MLKYLIEFKNRIYLSTISLFLFLFVSFFYKETILFILTEPFLKLNHGKQIYFIFTDVTEIFSSYFTIIIFTSIQIPLIFLLQNLFLFFSSGFYKSEYNFIKHLLKISFIGWLISTFFAHYILIPFSWSFFASFQNLATSNFITFYFESKLNEYIYFYIELYVTFLIYFQIFLFSTSIISYKNVNLKFLKRFRKFYYFLFILFSTLVSPPDVFSQISYMFLTVLSYEFCLFYTILVRQPIKPY